MNILSRVQSFLPRAVRANLPVPLQQAGIDASTALQVSSGIPGVSGVYSYLLSGSNTPIDYPPLHRCITLICSTVAMSVTRFGLTVVNDRGEVEINEAGERALRLMLNSPDGQHTAYTFHEDAIRDLVVEGNTLVLIQRRPGGNNIVSGLRRLSQSGARMEETARGRIYRARYAYEEIDQGLGSFAELNVAHARWPLMNSVGRFRGLSNAGRANFASPPVTAVRESTAIGLATDQYILNHFQYPGSHLTAHFPHEKNINFDTAEKASSSVEQMRRLGKPPVLPLGGKLERLGDDSMSDKIELQKMQAKLVGMFFGIPAVLLISDDTTAWGTGIGALTALWESEVGTYMARYLDALSMRMLPEGFHFRTDDLSAYSNNLGDISRMFKEDRAREGAEPLITDAEWRRMIGLRSRETGRGEETQTNLPRIAA